MNNKNQKSNNKLGFNLYEEALFQKHPSVKCLYDEKGNLMTPTESNDEFFILDIKNKIDKNIEDANKINENIEDNGKEKENDKKNNQNSQISIKINRVKEKHVDYKDTFYVEMSDEEKKNILNKKTEKENSSEPLSYKFSDSQKIFDKEVTDAMSKGEEYTKIESKFIAQLKKK